MPMNEVRRGMEGCRDCAGGGRSSRGYQREQEHILAEIWHIVKKIMTLSGYWFEPIDKSKPVKMLVRR